MRFLRSHGRSSPESTRGLKPRSSTLIHMQLRTARVCLDCEEVHDAQQCPTCASETFAFLTRWVPVPERRARPRPAEPANPEAVETYREMLSPQRPGGWSLIRRGALGLAIFGVAGWMWRRNTRAENSSRGSGPAHGGNRGTGS
jgi:hypothetical protein